jgi:hypothetical protein
MQPESARGPASVALGPVMIVDTHVNPSVPVRIAVDGDEIVVRYGRRGRLTSVARLDSTTLGAISTTTESADPAPDDRTSDGPVVLDGDRIITCWRTGDVEWGYRAVVQELGAMDGTPRGQPVVLSPPDVDVIGTPRAIPVDGHRAVAAFEASTGESFTLFVVALEAT